MTLIGPPMSSSQVPVTGAQGSPSVAQSSSLDTSQVSPLVGSTHGTGSSSSGSVGV